MAGYGTDQGFADYLAAQGLTLPSGSPSEAILRQIGSDYVDSAYEYKLQCSTRSGGFQQERAWPRSSHTLNGQPVPNDLIPPAWIQASYRAAYLNAQTPGWSTNQSTPGRAVKRQKVDSLEREFFSQEESGGSGDAAPGMPVDAMINGLVTHWLCSNTRSPNALFRVV